MHAIQACVRTPRCAPGIEKLYLSTQDDQDTGFVVMARASASRTATATATDVEVRSPSGTLVETLEGLSLRAVRKNNGSGPWVPSRSGRMWNARRSR